MGSAHVTSFVLLLTCALVQKSSDVLALLDAFMTKMLSTSLTHDFFFFFLHFLIAVSLLWLTYVGTFCSFVQFTDYEEVARGYGGQGLRLDRTNEDNMEEVLKQALQEYRKGNSVLVNVLIGKTNFREGSISV